MSEREMNGKRDETTESKGRKCLFVAITLSTTNMHTSTSIPVYCRTCGKSQKRMYLSTTFTHTQWVTMENIQISTILLQNWYSFPLFHRSNSPSFRPTRFSRAPSHPALQKTKQHMHLIKSWIQWKVYWVCLLRKHIFN